MTIHSEHPFAAPEPERDPVRRLRGRLGGTVTLWTAGEGSNRSGLTVSSLMIASGDPGHALALVDPDSVYVRSLCDAAAPYTDGETMGVGRDGSSDAVSFLRVGIPAVEVLGGQGETEATGEAVVLVVPLALALAVVVAAPSATTAACRCGSRHRSAR